MKKEGERRYFAQSLSAASNSMIDYKPSRARDIEQ